MGLNQYGLIGLGVMGSHLAQHLLEKDKRLSLYNLEFSITQTFTQTYGGFAFETLESFVLSLQHPRNILIMVTAGKAIDEVVNTMLPFLEVGDRLIDGGNSYYLDTQRRQDELARKGIVFIGMGISGGASGARYGASLMPSGSKEAIMDLMDVFEHLAAKTESQKACVTYIGTGGSGHFVKMVHNGIEYADMQILCDGYAILKHYFNYDNEKIALIFKQWNQGKLQSYLTHICAEIFKKKDPFKEGYLIDAISDQAESKGTGKWTVEYALRYQHPIGTLFTALDTRNVSQTSRNLTHAKHLKFDESLTLDQLEDALYASRIMAYAQGFSLIAEASKQNHWQLKLHEIAGVWRAGCIIQGQLIDKIAKIFAIEPSMVLHQAATFRSDLEDALPAWKHIVAQAVGNEIHIPLINSAYGDYIASQTPQMTTNLIQAMRDYFGGHTYLRNDRTGVFQTDWLNEN